MDVKVRVACCGGSSLVDDASAQDDSEEPSSSDEDCCGAAYGGVQDNNSFLEYDGLPHHMGKPAVPTFSVKPARSKVQFKSNLENLLWS